MKTSPMEEQSNCLVNYLLVQLEQKVKQVENATKLYFQSLFVLAAAIAAVLTALAALKGREEQILLLVTFGIPAFLISWFGCYLFIYWEHHMLRINLDYTEMQAAEKLNIKKDKVFLYHEDYLGVFNQANFPFTFKPIKFGPIKSVQAVFVIIALPFFLVCCFSLYKAREYFQEELYYYIYLAVILLAMAILLYIHIQCVFRERKLKKKLGNEHKNIYGSSWL